jgi:ubiquinone/menaquinone biosynthesis C-methylase UbiE
LEDVVVSVAQAGADPVFDRCWWIYSICRERLFADHTATIAAALESRLDNRPGTHLMEVGCGPGFYSRRLASRFRMRACRHDATTWTTAASCGQTRAP